MRAFVRVSLSDLLPAESMIRVFTMIQSRWWNARRPYWFWDALFRLRQHFRPSSPLSDKPVVETVKRKLSLPELNRMLNKYMDLHGLKRAELVVAPYMPGTRVTLDDLEDLLDFWKRTGYPQSFRTKPDGTCSDACRPCVSIALRLLDSCCLLARASGRGRYLEDVISMCRNDGALRRALSNLSPRHPRLPKLRRLISKWLAMAPSTKADVRDELQTVTREINHPVY